MSLGLRRFVRSVTIRCIFHTYIFFDGVHFPHKVLAEESNASVKFGDSSSAYLCNSTVIYHTDGMIFIQSQPAVAAEAFAREEGFELKRWFLRREGEWGLGKMGGREEGEPASCGSDLDFRISNILVFVKEPDLKPVLNQFCGKQVDLVCIPVHIFGLQVDLFWFYVKSSPFISPTPFVQQLTFSTSRTRFTPRWRGPGLCKDSSFVVGKVCYCFDSNGSKEWTEEIEYLDESGSVLYKGKGIRSVEPGVDDHVMVGEVKKPFLNALAVAKIVVPLASIS